MLLALSNNSFATGISSLTAAPIPTYCEPCQPSKSQAENPLFSCGTKRRQNLDRFRTCPGKRIATRDANTSLASLDMYLRLMSLLSSAIARNNHGSCAEPNN